MRKVITFVFYSVTTLSWAQIGARQAFDFLQLPIHSRLSALGGVNVSLADHDVNFLHNNPALAGDTLNGFVSAGYQFYVGNVGNAMFSYVHEFEKFGQLLTGIQHTNYGTSQAFDETGAATGEWSAGETAIVVGKTHRIGNFRVGVTLKTVFSNIAGYRANALLADLGGIFLHPDKDLTVGLALKNLGVVLSAHSPSASRALPIDVQAGVTMKPEYMPLRFSLTAYQLVSSGVLYDDVVSGQRSSPIRKAFNHLNLGAEILLHRNVNVLVGYNYMLHQALRFESGATGAGLSYGFSLFVKPVEFVFSRSAYTIGNAGYSFTLSTNTNQILKKRKI